MAKITLKALLMHLNKKVDIINTTCILRYLNLMYTGKISNFTNELFKFDLKDYNYDELNVPNILDCCMVL